MKNNTEGDHLLKIVIRMYLNVIKKLVFFITAHRNFHKFC